ncbi:ArsR/SmtB family transcription factor [Streptomyces otsuchiensis]|uniref:ArsR/SmtB family transcription factor n=1 Tax=Streptomyces otsuchiensis TaxID=2681388 RepID=UPI001D1309AA|nr:winged helix-turn-helix domain-containing protein [Streptomyces otsuchiensis]
MTGSTHTPDALAARVEELAARVTALEAGLPPGGGEPPAPPSDPSAPSAPSTPDDLYWALNRLRSELDELGEDRGGVMIAGSVGGSDPTVGRTEWQYVTTTATLLETDWATLADAVSALGQPVRLRLIKALLEGRSTVAELVELDGLGTTGQIYHHLRQLVAAGWLQSAGRGRYQVPPTRLVPLLAVLAAARR